MQLISKENILSITHLWEGDRFDDGRPRVPDDIIHRMKAISIEQAWGVLNGHGYKFQFAGDWMNLHPERVLVGRAVTCAFVPIRPDFNDAISKQGCKPNNDAKMSKIPSKSCYLIKNNNIYDKNCQ